MDFVILEMEEDRQVPLILGRPFLNTADAIIKVKGKELNLGVGEDRVTFLIDKAMKYPYTSDDTCFNIDVSMKSLRKSWIHYLTILILSQPLLRK